jgi:DNA-binding MarR family transcriptional regulator
VGPDVDITTAREFGETADSLKQKNRRPGRKALAELAYRQCGLTPKMIANYLGVSGPAVTKMIQKSEDLAQRDRSFRRSMERIRGALS